MQGAEGPTEHHRRPYLHLITMCRYSLPLLTASEVALDRAMSDQTVVNDAASVFRRAA